MVSVQEVVGSDCLQLSLELNIILNGPVASLVVFPTVP